MKTHQSIILMLLIGLLMGCSKDDSSKTNTELLTGSPWIHEYNMIDANNNLKPDDEIGDKEKIKLDFGSDGTLVHTLNGKVQNVTWHFEENETAIRIKGLKFDSIISASNEIIIMIYELNKSSLIFKTSPENNPEQLVFNVYGK